MDIREVSNDELEKELARRREFGKLPPIPVANPDYSPVREVCIAAVKDATEREYWDDDWDYRIYEAAIEAVYGGKFHEWRNKQDW